MSEKKCILVIDNDDTVCQMIRERFEGRGYKILIAYEGAEGLKKTEEGKPDCVILDIRMPQGEDGLTYIRKLRAYQHPNSNNQDRMRKIPVIVLTGVGDAQRPLFEAEGISGFIEKPFDFNDLQNKIEEVVGTH
jgi:CheY-like chemotaxis protein